MRFPAVAEERIPHCPQGQTQQRHKVESCLREKREKGSRRDGRKTVKEKENEDELEGWGTDGGKWLRKTKQIEGEVRKWRAVIVLG